MNSILQPSGERKCYITGSTRSLERHHIYAGGLRQVSEREGLWIWLHHDIHALAQQGKDNGWDIYLRREGQKAYERTHSRDEFIALIGRNYLDD